LSQIHSPFSFAAGGDPAPDILMRRSAVCVFELTSGGFARIGEIRSSARENLEKTGAKGAKSIPAHRGRFNGTRWETGLFERMEKEGIERKRLLSG